MNIRQLLAVLAASLSGMFFALWIYTGWVAAAPGHTADANRSWLMFGAWLISLIFTGIALAWATKR